MSSAHSFKGSIARSSKIPLSGNPLRSVWAASRALNNTSYLPSNTKRRLLIDSLTGLLSRSVLSGQYVVDSHAGNISRWDLTIVVQTGLQLVKLTYLVVEFCESLIEIEAYHFLRDSRSGTW
jgi:hypothetical protein